MTAANDFHLALERAGLEYSGMSWGGFNVFGDNKSIREVQRLQHLAGQVPQLRELIDDLQTTLQELEKELAQHMPPTSPPTSPP